MSLCRIQSADISVCLKAASQLFTWPTRHVWWLDCVMTWLNDFDETTDMLSWLYDVWFIIVVYVQHTHTHTHTHTHNCFTALFPGLPRWVGARRELLDFMVQGEINRGRHTIRLGATPSGLTSAHLHHPPYFLRAGCPSCRPTNSVKALKSKLVHSD